MSGQPYELTITAAGVVTDEDGNVLNTSEEEQ